MLLLLSYVDTYTFGALVKRILTAAVWHLFRLKIKIYVCFYCDTEHDTDIMAHKAVCVDTIGLLVGG